MDIAIRTVDSMRLAALVSRAPSLDFMGVWKKLRPTVAEQGLVGPKAVFASVFKATELTGPAGMVWYAATMILRPEQRIAAPLEELETEGRTFVVGTYKGSYEGLGQVWGSFVQTFTAAGHGPDFDHPCFEIYFDEASGAAPSEVRTELYVPIKRPIKQ